MGKLGKLIGWTVVPLLIIGVVLRIFVFDDWVVPNDPKDDKWLVASLAPSLDGGDNVLLLKVGKPGFGDLVRCPDPKYPGQWLVGRIVGMPGDVVETQGDLLRVNNNSYNSSDACDTPTIKIFHPQTNNTTDLECGRVEMGGGWNYMARNPKLAKEGTRSFKVGDDRVFLLSDDRTFHFDSRDYGLLPLDTCNRRIVFRLWGKKGWTDGKHRFSAIH